MFFLRFDATPRRTHPQSEEFAGAVACCWVVAPTISEAEATARRMIEAEGWIVDEPDEVKEVCRSSYGDASDDDDDNSGIRYYEQAIVDGEVCVFYTYPIDQAN